MTNRLSAPPTNSPALAMLLAMLVSPLAAQPSATPVWQADLGDGTYRNPVLHADYSDPDAGGWIMPLCLQHEWKNFIPAGREFKTSVGRWVGAKVGLFAVGSGKSFAEFDWFHVGPPAK